VKRGFYFLLLFSVECPNFAFNMKPLLSVISLCLMLFLGGCRHSAKEAPPVLPYGQMQEGDLVFRCGRGVFSRAVMTAEEDCLYSHVGVLVKEEGEWKVVHAVPGEPEFSGDFDRVKAESPEVFFQPGRAFRGALVHTGLEAGDRLSTLCRTALSCARDSVRFDGDYDLADSSKLYCTEFVWRLYRRAGLDLTEGRRRHLDIFRLHGDCILPGHLYVYSGNKVYYQY